MKLNFREFNFIKAILRQMKKEKEMGVVQKIEQPINIDKMINRFRSILVFLKHPKLEEQTVDIKGFKTLKITIQYFLIIFICSISINIFLFLIKQLDICPTLRTKYLPSTIYVVLIAPIAEELISRLPLRFSPYNILISTSLLFLFLFQNNIHLLLASLLIVSVWGYLLFTNTFNIKSYFEYLWKYHFIIIFYFFSIFFGLLHIGNYKIVAPIQYLLLPLLVLPQISASLIMGYVRVKYYNGIIITIMIHILYNCSAIIITSYI